jgi:hypothetical protein
MGNTVLKTFTWCTVVAAIVSALLLADAGNTWPRATGFSTEAKRARPAVPVRPALSDSRGTATAETRRDAAARNESSH